MKRKFKTVIVNDFTNINSQLIEYKKKRPQHGVGNPSPGLGQA